MFWKESLATGVEGIDSQHKDIIGKMNAIFEAGKRGKAAEELLPTLKYLENYVKDHFDNEEELQVKSGYPKYQQHKVAHEEFIKKVDKLFEKFKTDGASLSVIIDVNKTILDLFVQHITIVDKEFAKYYREYSK